MVRGVLFSSDIFILLVNKALQMLLQKVNKESSIYLVKNKYPMKYSFFLSRDHSIIKSLIPNATTRGK